MCAGVFCLAVSDALAKGLSEHYSTVEIVFFRMLVSVPLIAGIGIAVNGPRVLKTRRLSAHVARGIVATGATYTFISGLALLPLAEATAIAFAAPVFVTMLSVPLLKERVGPHRWAAVLIGFVGVLVIVRPGMAGFEPAASLPLAAALFYALLMMSARMLRTENIWAMMFYMYLVPLIVSAAVIPWFWRTPALEHLPAFLAVGAAGTAALTLITQGFRLGPAAVVAPFDYTGLLWATLLGWVFWEEILEPWSFVGAVAIVASGVYLAYREARGASASPPRPT